MRAFTAELLTASFEEEHPSSVRGHIDTIGAASGILGWALDLRAPLEPVRLQLVVDDIVVAECETTMPREDVAAVCGIPGAMSGFSFPSSIFAELRPYLPTKADQPIAIRVADQNWCLPFPGDIPTIKELAALTLAEGQAVDDGRFIGSEKMSSLDMSVAIEQMRTEAQSFLEHPLRPISENLLGYIESVSANGSGLVWVTGWIRKGHALAFSAVISDRQKFTAGLLLTSYDREDLPKDAVAVFGVMRTEWKPSVGSPDVFLFFGPERPQFFLRSAKPFRLVSLEDILGRFEQIRPICHGTHTIALQRLLTEPENWMPSTARLAGFAVQATVDRALAVAGFGCFVEGWVLSSVKRVESFFLKLGSVVLPCDKRSLYFKPRSDLASAVPGGMISTDKAGFVVAFLGEVSGNDLVDPILKVVFSDGSSTNHPVDPKVLRRLGVSATTDDVRIFYPSVHAEDFFPEFMASAEREMLAAMSPPLPYKATPAPEVLIFVVPEDRSDAYLLFAEVFDHLQSRPRPPGVVFIATRGRSRPDVILSFSGLASALPIAASLYFVDNPGQAFHALPTIIDALSVNSFAFVNADIFLTPTGWEAALDAVAAPGDMIEFLEIKESAADVGDATEGRAAECFCWSATAFKIWYYDAVTRAAEMPIPVALGWYQAEAQRHEKAAVRSRVRRESAWLSLSPQQGFGEVATHGE